MTINGLTSQADGLHQEAKYALITSSVGATTTGHALLRIRANVPLAGQELIAAFLCVSKPVFIMEIVLIQTLARKLVFSFSVAVVYLVND